MAIHAPHREGDQRNHHAHVLTTTRQLESDGFTTKTRVLDSARTGGAEIEQMRGVWAELQNRALERAGEESRVDHRSLEAQRSDALSRGEELRAEELDRDPEVKLGPVANSMERRAQQAAEREGREYQPVTERGAVAHAARQARAAFQDMRARLELARETYGAERDARQGRVSAGLAALRAAAGKDRNAERDTDDFKERLARIVGWDDLGQGGPEPDMQREDANNLSRASARLREVLGKERGAEVESDRGDSEKPSIRGRLDEVLNRPRERLELEDGRESEREEEIESAREVDRGGGAQLVTPPRNGALL